MKMKTLLASAALAAAVPLGSVLASGSATTLSGPQGTGWYGWVDPLDLDRNTLLSAEERAARVATYDRNAGRVISRGEYASTGDTRVEPRRSYSGPSWSTNPPVPAP
jgi:hypothetical protein